MTDLIRCNKGIIGQTLTHIREGGKRQSEALVLWLGRRTPASTEVVEAYLPPQQTAFDRFYVPPEAMREIMRHLRDRRLFICAQVHSHPKEAFHSEADDEWALIRHQGALSLVIPRFGVDTEVDGYLDSIAAFQLSAKDTWDFVPRDELGDLLEITDADR